MIILFSQCFFIFNTSSMLPDSSFISDSIPYIIYTNRISLPAKRFQLCVKKSRSIVAKKSFYDKQFFHPIHMPCFVFFKTGKPPKVKKPRQMNSAAAQFCSAQGQISVLHPAKLLYAHMNEQRKHRRENKGNENESGPVKGGDGLLRPGG